MLNKCRKWKRQKHTILISLTLYNKNANRYNTNTTKHNTTQKHRTKTHSIADLAKYGGAFSTFVGNRDMFAQNGKPNIPGAAKPTGGVLFEIFRKQTFIFSFF